MERQGHRPRKPAVSWREWGRSARRNAEELWEAGVLGESGGVRGGGQPAKRRNVRKTLGPGAVFERLDKRA